MLIVCAFACGGSHADTTSGAPAAAASTPAAAPAAAPTGPIDVCGIITGDKAKTILGSLGPQPPVTTDHAGFNTDACMYLGPSLSGEGAQTIFSRLMVQAATGKDGPDLLQFDADKKKATISLSGVGSAAKRNEAGTFVWTTNGSVACTAEVSSGVPNGLTPEASAEKLAGFCRDVFAAAR